MIPALWPGESILVDPANGHDLRVGDVAVFVRSGQRSRTASSRCAGAPTTAR